jgi:hypothetical protein
MTTTNKQILMYAGGAIVVGAVGFFVYSFFQKPTLQLGNVTIGNDDEPKSTNKDWTSFFKQQQDIFPQTVANPRASMGFDAKLWNSVK